MPLGELESQDHDLFFFLLLLHVPFSNAVVFPLESISIFLEHLSNVVTLKNYINICCILHSSFSNVCLTKAKGGFLCSLHIGILLLYMDFCTLLKSTS